MRISGLLIAGLAALITGIVGLVVIVTASPPSAAGNWGFGLAADAWGVDSPLLGFGLLAAVSAALFAWRVGLPARKQFRTNLGKRY